MTFCGKVNLGFLAFIFFWVGEGRRRKGRAFQILGTVLRERFTCDYLTTRSNSPA